MSSMSVKDTARRAQLITPFGIGSLIVGTNGTSLLVCSLDDWFQSYRGGLNLDEFKVREPRLERLLKVSHFRLPPDFRKKQKFITTQMDNIGITIPTVRFPLTCYCPSCGRMDLALTSYTDKDADCDSVECIKRKQKLVQMRFIGVCEHGHLMDIPWRTWLDCTDAVCATQKPVFVEKGGGTLGDAQVRCGCGKQTKSLSELLISESDDETKKSTGLKCCSGEPWKSDKPGPACPADLRLTLRNANNVYYAQVESALYISKEEKVPQIIDIIDGTESSKSTFEMLLGLIPDDLGKLAENLKKAVPKLAVFEISDIAEAIAVKQGKHKAPGEDGEYSEDVMRREEFDVLVNARNDDNLRILVPPLEEYKVDGFDLSKWFSSISLVERVRETRVLAGFSRIKANVQKTRDQKRAMLWKHEPKLSDRWLPCAVVYGEGIFLRFSDEALSAWEKTAAVDGRANVLVKAHVAAVSKGFAKVRPVSARFVLIHTFAHLLMNRLTFACGYSSASLRERLYVSKPGDAAMNALLIYTAAGDSEGTLGGLVAMGGHEVLPSLIREALEEATWCSSDPVCRESSGQGPDSCNLAACHCCSLVPETACEEFNRLLDRLLVVDGSGAGTGYFSTGT